MDSKEIYAFFSAITCDETVDELLYDFILFYTGRKYTREDVYTNVTRYPDSIYLSFMYGDGTRLGWIMLFKDGEIIKYRPEKPNIAESFSNFLIYRVRTENIRKYLESNET